ncbi:MAG: hypothetical protein AABZ33_14170 [Chloroflexota bacterium]
MARPYAIVGWLAALVGAVGATTLRIVDPVPIIRNPFGFGDVALVGFGVMGVAFASVGALLVVRRPLNAIGWGMVLIGVGHAVGIFAAAATYFMVAVGTQEALRTAQLTGWLTTLFITMGGFLFGIGFIFPTGRGHTPRWDRFVRLFLIGGPVAWLMIVLQPGPLSVFPTIENPFGLGPDLRSAPGMEVSPVAAASSVIFVPLLLWSLVSRYRLAASIERQQLKWFGLALVVATGAFGFSGAGAVVAGDPPEIGLAVFGFAGALVPVAIGIAILRYHLYDIDRLISRTLGYALVTGALAAVFATSAIGLSALLGSIAAGDTVAVAASTLLVFTLFGPLRRRAQVAVDARFDRSHYDASRTVQALTARLRDDIDLERIEIDVVGVVGRTFHPTASVLWLRRYETTVRRSPVTIPGHHAAKVTTT